MKIQVYSYCTVEPLKVYDLTHCVVSAHHGYLRIMNTGEGVLDTYDLEDTYFVFRDK